ncbi:MAG: ABC transporter substrate-binding protein [Gammaproteobacteria bacterium]|nr:ABC transporter substrate-binding protein [Gammaproteobacteria bacterium]
MKFLSVALAFVLLGGCGSGSEQAADPAGKEETTEQTTAYVRGVTDDEIVLGNHTDLSGPVAIWGVGATNGARLRFDRANDEGGIHGRKIRFIVEDTQYQVPRSIQAVNKLINRDEIFAMVLGLGTPMNNALMTQQFDANVPNLFPISGARSMVEPRHPMKFTQRGIYYDEMRAAVKYFIEEKGKKAVCAIYQDTDYGQEILEGVEDQLESMGLPLAGVSAHKPTESEFTAAILRLRKADCDLVLMGTVHRDTILVLETARKMGWEGVAWVGNNAAYGQVIADQESGEGYYAFVHIAKLYADDEMSPEVRSWWDDYVARYDVEPDLPAMEGYRGADLAVIALEAAGRDLTVDSLLAAVEGITEYHDIFGYSVSFSATKHSGATESVLSQVQDGRWVKLEQSISY